MNKSKTFLSLALLICFACGIQVLFMYKFMNPRVLEWPDPNDYLAIARSLANGNSFSADIHNLYRFPGYPYFLSCIISIVGCDLVRIRLAHVACHALFLVGAFFLGKEWKDEKLGLLLVLLCALYPLFIYVPLTLYPESALVFISPWVVYSLLRISRSFTHRALLAAACLIALGTVVRPTFVVVSMVFALWFALTQTPVLQKIKVVLALIVLPISLVFLWGCHNYRVQGHFIISTSASLNLFMGFNQNTTIYTKVDCPIPEAVQAQLNTAKDDFERDTIYKKSAVQFIKQNPGKSLYLAVVRMLDLWNPIPHTHTHYSFTRKLISAVPYMAVLVCAIGGFYVLRKDAFARMMLGILVLNTAANGFFAVSVRYRMIFDIILLLMAACYLLHLAGKLTGKRQPVKGSNATEVRGPFESQTF